MTAVARAKKDSDYLYTDADFEAIAKRAHQQFGLHLTDTKKDLVYSRLIKRLRHLGLQDFKAYCALIDGPTGESERVHMLSALTTNVTHFMREEHHFRMLRESVLPPLLAKARNGGRLRIWSAGCSAGQEPYSLAFTLLDLCPDAERYDIRILATDVDPEILKTAKAGIYRNEELQAIPERARSQHIAETTARPDSFSIGERPRALIRFGLLNLMESWPMRGQFDIIFCRNVAIYFDKDTQARLWNRYADQLAPGGHLCIGHSERIAGTALARFQNVGVTAYRLQPSGSPSSAA
jgi:chemotaxis protein methyltransferase CheR